MIINSNPFVYNEGFPTYTEIEAVNDRVTELENDESLLNISKTDAVESLSASLNKLIEGRSKKISSVDITADNNVNAVHFSGAILSVKHNLNSQVGIFQNMALNNIANNQAFDTLRAENIKATGGTLTDVNFVNVNFVSPQNTTFDNLIVDNLAVLNDFTPTILNQSNFDNVMITNSNVYNSFLRNANMQGDHADIEYAYINHMTTDGIDLNVFQVTPQTEPVNSETVLGYDLNGNVIPVNPLYMVDLVLNAEYVAVDTNGDAVAGTKSRVVEQSENLITANAVDNAFNDFNDYIADEDANVYQLFEDTANNLHNGFNDFNNDFNNFNAGLNDTFNNFVIDYNPVTNGLNDLNNGLNELNNVYNSISNLAGPEVFNILNGYNNTLNNHNNSLNGLSDIANALYSTMMPQGVIHYNSSSPVNYMTVNNIQFIKGLTSSGSNIATASFSEAAIAMSFDSATNTLIYTAPMFENAINPPASYYEQYGKWIFNNDMSNAFNNCQNFNEPVSLNNATNLYAAFRGCANFNQPVNVDKATNLIQAFYSCVSFNQSVVIPNGINNISSTFGQCRNLNQPISIPSSVRNMDMTFSTCYNFNQLVNIPNGVTSLFYTFASCHNFNQPIVVPSSVNNLTYTFEDCFNFGQRLNAVVPGSVLSNVIDGTNAFTNSGIFTWQGEGINLYNIRYARNMFRNCRYLENQTYLSIGPNAIDIQDMFRDSNLRRVDEIHIRNKSLSQFNIANAFRNSLQSVGQLRIPSAVPKSTSNVLYNCLVNGWTGYSFPAANIYNVL